MNMLQRDSHDLTYNTDIYRMFIDGESDYGIIMLDTDGMIQTWNKGAELIHGYTSLEVTGKHIGLLYSAEERKNKAPEKCMSNAKTQGTAKYQEWWTHKNGERLWLDIKVTALFDSQKNLLGYCKVIRDLSEQKKIGQEKDRLQEILGIINETARIGAWEVDLVNNKVIWSKVTKEIHGVPADYQPDLSEAINFYKEGDSRNIIINIFNEVVANGTPYDIELIIVTAQGKELWCRSIGQAEFIDGKCVRLFGTFQDIDQQKRTQIELQNSEEQFRRSFDLSGIGMALVNPDAIPIRVNRRLSEILGYSFQEFYNLSVLDITHPDDIAKDVAHAKTLLNGESDYYQMIKRYIHKNGSIIWTHITVSLVRDANKTPLHFVSEVEDITEKKKAEDQLKRINAELTAMFNSGARVSIISADMNGVITHFNKGAEMMLGYTADEVIGKASPLLMHKPEQIAERGQLLSKMLDKELKGLEILRENANRLGSDSGEWLYVRKDGSTLPVQLVISTISDDQGNVRGYLGIATDITQIKEAEASIRKYALLEAKNKEMEQFTFIASHDLLEPLQTVSSFVELLKDEYLKKLDADGAQYIEFISGSTSRMMELVKGLLHYSRLGKEKQLEKADINLLVKDVTDDLGLQIAESEAILTISTLPTLEVYPLELKQLFQNLITNAIKFRKRDLPLTIDISAERVNNKWTFVVRDNGIGIADRNKEKIFAIFQRLHDRQDFAGTGIGLSYCKKIVELHKGNIWVESAPGEGSRFYFTLMTDNHD